MPASEVSGPSVNVGAWTELAHGPAPTRPTRSSGKMLSARSPREGDARVDQQQEHDDEDGSGGAVAVPLGQLGSGGGRLRDREPGQHADAEGLVDGRGGGRAGGRDGLGGLVGRSLDLA